MLNEAKGASDGGGNPIQVVLNNFKYLIEDHQLQVFILTRGLLIATALAPPFMVAQSAQSDHQNFSDLG